MLESDKYFHPIIQGIHHYHPINHEDHDVYQQRQLPSPRRRNEQLFSGIYVTASSSSSGRRGRPSIAEMTKRSLTSLLVAAILLSHCCDAHYVKRHADTSGGGNSSSLAKASSGQLVSHSTPDPLSSGDIPNPSAHPESSRRAQLISTLVSTLEQLNILQGFSDSCFRLHRITRRDIDTASPGRRFEVGLFIEKIPLSNDSGAPVASSNDSIFQNNKGGSQGRGATSNACWTEPLLELLVDSTKEDTVGVGATAAVRGGKGLGPIMEHEAATPASGGHQREDDTPNGLSQTHIVALSACSTIIGLFFLIAGILRVRNYIKRARMEQAMANRPKFRSCSVALRNPTQSMEQLRRDSSASKTSRQNSVTTKGSNGSQTNGSSRENSSSNSPRHEPDTAPLLIITRPSDLAAAAGSNSSIQYIDEDGQVVKKKAPVVPVVKNGASDGCYIVAVCPAPHIPASIAEKLESAKGRGHLGMERGSSLKSRPNPKVNMERRTSLKIILPSTQGNVTRSVRPLGQSPRAKLENFQSPKMNGEPQIYQLINSSDSLQAERVKAMLGDPAKNGSWEKPLSKVKGYQAINGDDTRIPGLSECYIGRLAEPAAGKLCTVSAEVLMRKDSPDNPEEDVLRDSPPPKGLYPSPASPCADLQSPSVDLDLISPATDVSYFGLSQSDVSLSSVTNQGNEFFGQSEYHPADCGLHPCRGLDLAATRDDSTPISTSHQCDGGQYDNMAFSPSTPQGVNFCNDALETKPGPPLVNGSSSWPDILEADPADCHDGRRMLRPPKLLINWQHPGCPSGKHEADVMRVDEDKKLLNDSSSFVDQNGGINFGHKYNNSGIPEEIVPNGDPEPDSAAASAVIL